MVLVPMLVVLTARPAFAYLGPGAGLMAIGTFIAVVAAIAVAVAGFLWYPIKRFIRRMRRESSSKGTATSDR